MGFVPLQVLGREHTLLCSAPQRLVYQHAPQPVASEPALCRCSMKLQTGDLGSSHELAELCKAISLGCYCTQCCM